MLYMLYMPLPKDILCLSNSGLFRYKSACSLVKKLSPLRPLTNWSWVLKINSHPIVIYFLWLAIQPKIPLILVTYLRMIFVTNVLIALKKPSTLLVIALKAQGVLVSDGEGVKQLFNSLSYGECEN